jgi:hypothetical protein
VLRQACYRARTYPLQIYLCCSSPQARQDKARRHTWLVPDQSSILHFAFSFGRDTTHTSQFVDRLHFQFHEVFVLPEHFNWPLIASAIAPTANASTPAPPPSYTVDAPRTLSRAAPSQGSLLRDLLIVLALAVFSVLPSFAVVVLLLLLTLKAVLTHRN